MKKSNKILLGGLLTIILVVVAVHIGLYANYKSGNYIPFNENQSDEATHVKEFANGRSIHIRNLNNVVLRIGDKMKVEQYGEVKENIQLVERGGHVEMYLKDSVNSEQFFHYVIVYVPQNSIISTHKTNIRVEGEKGKPIGHLNFKIAGGHLGFTETKNKLQVDSMHVEAINNATIQLHDVQINKLFIRLQASELIDQDADIQQLILNTDSTSRINLQAKHFSKLTTKTTAHE